MAALLLGACKGSSEPILLGTLERDRITVPAEASERIVRIDVSEGDELESGQSILALDTVRIDASIEQARAEERAAQAVLDEFLNGRRKEAIDAARAQLTGATARAVNARRERDRAAEIRKRGLNAQADLDRTETALRSAEAERDAAGANLAEFLNGSRVENIELAAARLEASKAAVEQLELTRQRYRVVSTRAGRIDAIPFKLGSQPAAGAIVASLLTGPVYARVYVPASQRNALAIGSRCKVRLTGSEQNYTAVVRSLRSDPAFTPYFALTGDDASRLAYRSEIVLEGDDLQDLPVGQPVQVDCAAAARADRS
ncbi:MAG: HlyD family efflux transporter periplasmic adaptor subunit [Gammaproteobacteria bacterium]|nr:HlyD family efflux transporter periplasmic adaptor subunit [Gammaproteobacteria bacterium]MBK9468707.1 HlyD family efflux transporter periplasmic adaptor subunit [Gammaproteobacteria bacterium]